MSHRQSGIFLPLLARTPTSHLGVPPDKYSSSSLHSGVRNRVVSKRVVLADVPSTPTTGRNEGTKNKTSVPKPARRCNKTKRRHKKRSEGIFAKTTLYKTVSFPLEISLVEIIFPCFNRKESRRSLGTFDHRENRTSSGWSLTSSRRMSGTSRPSLGHEVFAFIF